MNTHDPRQPLPPNYQVPPGWERFQPPVMVVPQVQTVVMEEPLPVQPRQPTWLRFWRQIGGGSLALSIGVHVALLLLAGAVIVGSQVMKPVPDFLPTGRSAVSEEASRVLSEKVLVKHTATLARRSPQVRLQVNGPAVYELPQAEPAVLPETAQGMGATGGKLSSLSAGIGMGKGLGLHATGPSSFHAKLPNFLGTRCSAQSRLEKLRQNGGTPECELAVSRSLEWLKSQQNKDGSWGRTNKAAMTGLSLLCFLGRCETPESPFYGENVRDGMLYLVELARKNPHGILSETPQANPATYEHGIATYALGEMYSFYRLGKSSLPGLRETFEQGVQIIIAHQNERGAWSYGGKLHAYDKDSGGRTCQSRAGSFRRSRRRSIRG